MNNTKICTHCKEENIQKRETEMNRTALKRKTPLKSSTPLKARKRLNPISDRQRERNAKWKKITDQKALNLNHICQWCGKLGRRDDPFNPLEGHHIIKRSYRIDTWENCYLCHRLCHSFIEDNSIDVREFPNKKAWENRHNQQ